MKVAAVVYEGGGSHAVDAMLRAVAVELKGAGIRIVGAIQINEERSDAPCAKMVLEEITSGRTFDISTCKMPGDESCTLDPPALEDVVGLVQSRLDGGADLILINRFGKQEVAGAGFRSVIEAAVAHDVPVVVAINEAHLAHWMDFTGGGAERLVPDRGRIAAWCQASVSGASAAAATQADADA